MKGFELTFNGVKKYSYFSDRIVSIFIESVYRRERIVFRATNFEIGETRDWLDSTLKLGDEIDITIKDLEKESEPESIYPVWQSPCHGEELTSEAVADLIETYHELEQLLTSIRLSGSK